MTMDSRSFDGYWGPPHHVRFLIECKFANVNQLDHNTETAMCCAIGHHDIDLVHWLLERGADASKPTGDGFIPIHTAVVLGRQDICKLLMDHGAKFYTNLHEAVFKGQIDRVRELFPQHDMTAAIWRKAPCMFYAIAADKLEVIKWLVQNGMSVSQANPLGNTPLMCASWNGKLNIVKWLIDNGALATEQNKDSYTPLLWAASFGRLSVVEYLIEKGASLTETTAYRKTPLLCAAMRGHLHVVQWIIQYEHTHPRPQKPPNVETDTHTLLRNMEDRVIEKEEKGNIDKV